MSIPGGKDTVPPARAATGFQKVRHYGFLSPQSNVSLDEVRALVALGSAVMRDPIATAAHHRPAASSTGATNAFTEPTRGHGVHRLRVVEVIFHRVGVRDSG